MITLVTETSFKDKEGIYRKFNIQFLELAGELYNTIVVNLDGYDVVSCGLNYSSFNENKELFLKHINTMFGLIDLDKFECIIIEKNIAYIRATNNDSTFYGEFLQMADGAFEKEYKRVLEK